jgi:ABC-type Fe3+ transport system substrate-binding protein
MRDWILIVGPIAVIAYFAGHPADFKAFMDWFARLLP